MTIPRADLLVQVLPDGAEMRFQPGQQVLIGRDTDVQVLVAHPRASRHHASLTYQQAGWVLTDQSSNGTFVDGRPIHQLTVHGPVAIRVGDPEDGTGIRLATAIAGTVPPAPDPGGYQAVQAISPSPAGFAPAPPGPVPLAPAPAAGFAAQPAPGFAGPPVPGPPVPGPPVPDLGAPAGFVANGAAPEPGTPAPAGIPAPAQVPRSPGSVTRRPRRTLASCPGRATAARPPPVPAIRPRPLPSLSWITPPRRRKERRPPRAMAPHPVTAPRSCLPSRALTRRAPPLRRVRVRPKDAAAAVPITASRGWPRWRPRCTSWSRCAAG